MEMALCAMRVCESNGDSIGNNFDIAEVATTSMLCVIPIVHAVHLVAKSSRSTKEKLGTVLGCRSEEWAVAK